MWLAALRWKVGVSIRRCGTASGGVGWICWCELRGSKCWRSFDFVNRRDMMASSVKDMERAHKREEKAMRREAKA